MTVAPAPVLILRRSEVTALMNPAAYLAAVEAAFRAYANGDASVPMPMHIAVQNGGFHVKGGS
jgi:ornithine cyclodeaminase/alanine dehydrogenase-like protein (mu-crystallin family)